jgi:hypothetical protein
MLVKWTILKVKTVIQVCFLFFVFWFFFLDKREALPHFKTLVLWQGSEFVVKLRYVTLVGMDLKMCAMYTFNGSM